MIHPYTALSICVQGLMKPLTFQASDITFSPAELERMERRLRRAKIRAKRKHRRKMKALYRRAREWMLRESCRLGPKFVHRTRGDGVIRFRSLEQEIATERARRSYVSRSGRLRREKRAAFYEKLKQESKFTKP